MKWFKHLTHAMDDLFVMDLERRFSHLGYAFWFKTLELIGSQGRDGRLTISWANYLQKIRTRRPTVVQLLESCRNHGKLVFEDKGDSLEIFCEKFSEYASDYVRYSGAERQRLLRQGRETSATSQSRIEEEEKKKKKKIRARASLAIPPKEIEVWEYAKSIGFTKQETRKWWDHHAARGWKLGRGLPMKDWKAALRTWKSKGREFAREKGGPIPYTATAEPKYRCNQCGATMPPSRQFDHVCPTPGAPPTEDEVAAVDADIERLKKELKK